MAKSKKSERRDVSETVKRFQKARMDIMLIDRAIAMWTRRQGGQHWVSAPEFCPLCSVYLSPIGVANNCEGCPIRNYTGRAYCKGTPAHEYDKLWLDFDVGSSSLFDSFLDEEDLTEQQALDLRKWAGRERELLLGLREDVIREHSLMKKRLEEICKDDKD